MAIQLTCEHCQAAFAVRAYRKGTARFCSTKCRTDHRIVDTIDQWEARLGEPIEPFLRRRYERDGASYRDLFEELGLTEARSLRRVLSFLGIRVRRGSEAVASQWRTADERRKATGDRARKHLAPYLGKFANGVAPSPREIVVRHWLEELGVRCVPQYRVSFASDVVPARRTRAYRRAEAYFLDLYLPDFRAAIEVFNNKSKLDPLRHLRVRHLGVRVFYFPNRIVDREQRDLVHQFVAALKRARLDPALALDKELVRWGYPEGAPVLKHDANEIRA